MFKYLEIQTRTLTNIHAFQHAEITEISAQLDHLNMPNENWLCGSLIRTALRSCDPLIRSALLSLSNCRPSDIIPMLFGLSNYSLKR